MAPKVAPHRGRTAEGAGPNGPGRHGAYPRGSREAFPALSGQRAVITGDDPGFAHHESAASTCVVEGGGAPVVDPGRGQRGLGGRVPAALRPECARRPVGAAGDLAAAGRGRAVRRTAGRGRAPPPLAAHGRAGPAAGDHRRAGPGPHRDLTGLRRAQPAVRRRGRLHGRRHRPAGGRAHPAAAADRAPRGRRTSAGRQCAARAAARDGPGRLAGGRGAGDPSGSGADPGGLRRRRPGRPRPSDRGPGRAGHVGGHRPGSGRARRRRGGDHDRVGRWADDAPADRALRRRRLPPQDRAGRLGVAGRRGGDGHRRGRLDRRGAGPSGGPLHPGHAGARGALGTRAVGHRPGAAGRPPRSEGRRGACRRHRRRPHGRAAARAPPVGGAARRGAQARADDGGQPRRGDQEQRAGHPHPGRPGARAA